MLNFSFTSFAVRAAAPLLLEPFPSSCFKFFQAVSVKPLPVWERQFCNHYTSYFFQQHVSTTNTELSPDVKAKSAHVQGFISLFDFVMCDVNTAELLQ